MMWNDATCVALLDAQPLRQRPAARCAPPLERRSPHFRINWLAHVEPPDEVGSDPDIVSADTYSEIRLLDTLCPRCIVASSQWNASRHPEGWISVPAPSPS